MEYQFDKEKHIKYCVESSDENFLAMLDMYKMKHYNWVLFMGHLVLEKLLKAYYTKTRNEVAPYLHDLRRIGEKAGLTFDKKQTIEIETISQFNIQARYDDYKQQFYKLCTPEYTAEWLEKIKEIRLWIKTMLSE